MEDHEDRNDGSLALRVYLGESADKEKAKRIVVDAKSEVCRHVALSLWLFFFHLPRYHIYISCLLQTDYMLA